MIEASGNSPEERQVSQLTGQSCDGRADLWCQSACIILAQCLSAVGRHEEVLDTLKGTPLTHGAKGGLETDDSMMILNAVMEASLRGSCRDGQERHCR